jgi:hypothetical protein
MQQTLHNGRYIGWDLLGASITLVTHFYANRAELFIAVADELLNSDDVLQEELTHDAVGDYSRLMAFLTWLAPIGPALATAVRGLGISPPPAS